MLAPLSLWPLCALGVLGVNNIGLGSPRFVFPFIFYGWICLDLVGLSLGSTGNLPVPPGDSSGGTVPALILWLDSL
jgi:hypothetical protein